MVAKKILLSEPNIIGNELKYLKQCLKSNWISSSGEFVNKFENAVKKFTGAKYAISCINGTAALDLSLKILGVKTGDEVIVPTITFIAPINAVIYNGASPLFMDADNYFNIDVKKCMEFINNETVFKNGYTYNKKTSKKIKAIIVVHVWGNAVNLDQLVNKCKNRNIKIIEDASESLGTVYKEGRYKKKHTGTIGNIGCLSFNGNKIISGGNGGMILTNNITLAKNAKYYSTQSKNDSIYFIHNNVGYNYRMSSINAAFAMAQLENMDFFLKSKLKLFNKYKNEINKIKGLQIYDVPHYAINNHWMNVLYIDNQKYDKTIKKLIHIFNSNNIQVRPVWYLNHKQKMFKKFQKYKINNAPEMIKNSLCLPSSTNLNSNNLKKIIRVLNA